jgi:hypothetical protein
MMLAGFFCCSAPLNDVSTTCVAEVTPTIAIGQQPCFAKSVALQLQKRADCRRAAIVVARVPMQRASLQAPRDRHGTLPQQALEKT